MIVWQGTSYIKMISKLRITQSGMQGPKKNQYFQETLFMISKREILNVLKELPEQFLAEDNSPNNLDTDL